MHHQYGQKGCHHDTLSRIWLYVSEQFSNNTSTNHTDSNTSQHLTAALPPSKPTITAGLQNSTAGQRLPPSTTSQTIYNTIMVQESWQSTTWAATWQLSAHILHLFSVGRTEAAVQKDSGKNYDHLARNSTPRKSVHSTVCLGLSFTAHLLICW